MPNIKRKGVSTQGGKGGATSANLSSQLASTSLAAGPSQTAPPPPPPPPPTTSQATNRPRQLMLNGKTFKPHDAVRQTAKIFKKSFGGPWPKWSEVPDEARNMWFNELKRYYFWDKKLDGQIRDRFEEIGAKRLSDHLSKAKKKYKATKICPKWIAENHWNTLLQYWEKEDIKKISEINSKNRLSSSNNNGPSLHTGGSRPLEEYFDKYVEEMGVEPTAPELFIVTHHSKKKNDWCDLKSKSAMHDFQELKTRKLREHIGDTSSRNINGVEDDTSTTENDTFEEVEDDIAAGHSLDHQKELSLWVEAVGGPKKGRIYGLGSQSFVVCPLNSKAGYSKASTQDYASTSKFEEAVQCEIDKRLGDVRAFVQEVVQQEVQAAVRLLASSFQAENLAQASTNGLNSSTL